MTFEEARQRSDYSFALNGIESDIEDIRNNYMKRLYENVIATLDSLCTQKILWNTEKKRKKKHVQHNK